MTPLAAFVEALGRTGGDRIAAVRRAAEAVASDPWRVVEEAGWLARCDVAVATSDLGLVPGTLRVRGVDAPGVVPIGQGAPYPVRPGGSRKRRGAFDTPRTLARQVVASTLRVAERCDTGMDLACGPGAFLVALAEAGIEQLVGRDIDAVAIEVARIAVPDADLAVADGLAATATADVVVGNPPFVPPERQDKEYRAELRRRFPWLHGRFDLAVPFAAVAVDACRSGGAVGLVLPAPILVQPYGAALRRGWVLRHHLVAVADPEAFAGASVEVTVVVLRPGAGPARLPNGIDPERLAELPAVPLDPALREGDLELAAAVRGSSVPLETLALVDTGVVAHGPGRGRQHLLFDEPGEGRVPYADAAEFFAGRRRWLAYRPEEMHRAKKPSMFEGDKIVVQRVRGRGQPVRAAIDRDGVYVGHTCTVVVPGPDAPPLTRLLELVRSPVAHGVLRVERGRRMDVYPRDIGALPVPRTWLEGSGAKAWPLTASQRERLEALGR